MTLDWSLVLAREMNNPVPVNDMFILRASIGASVTLCQWCVFSSIRKHIFGRHEPVSSSVAYGMLCLFALVNLLAVKTEFDSTFLQGDVAARNMVALVVFCYLGLVLTLSVVFLFVSLQSAAFSLKDFVAGVVDRRKGSASTLATRIECSVASQGRGHAAVATSCATHSIHGAQSGTVMNRRAFLRWSATAGLVGAAVFAKDGLSQAYQQPVIEEFDVYHPRLAGITEPVTLLHISDFHYGIFMAANELEKLVGYLNAIEGDGLIMTGDFFHSWVTPVEEAVPILSRLRLRQFGNLAVLGNHDFYSGESRSVDSLNAAGFRLLRNEWVTLTNGDAVIHVGGIDDPEGDWGPAFHSFPEFVLKTPETTGLRILLSHRPSILTLAAKAGLDLVMAGHLHGGQIILPTFCRDCGVSFAGLISSYTHGWYRDNKTRMYLNRGLGLTFLPWRVNCPPEIALFHLKPARDERVAVMRTQSSHDLGRNGHWKPAQTV